MAGIQSGWEASGWRSSLKKEGSRMGKKTFFVMWQRMANSGWLTVDAKDAAEAIDLVNFNANFVKLTVVEMAGNKKVIEVGVKN